MEVWKNGYSSALQERPRPRLTSDDVHRAMNGLSSSWNNFYHLVADALNRILDEKKRTRDLFAELTFSLLDCVYLRRACRQPVSANRRVTRPGCNLSTPPNIEC